MADPARPIPEAARIVIVGGGVIGASVAYHLTRLGQADVLLLEQGRLSCGTTWHAAGLVGPLRASESGTRLVQYSAQLYADLEAETGLATGYRQVGGLIVARTPERMSALRRTAATGAAFGLPADLVDVDRIADLAPMFRTDDLLGGLWLPGDGTVNPTDLTLSLAKGARQRGARIVERCRVVGVETVDAGSGRRVSGVRVATSDAPGDEVVVRAEIVVNCAGQWANALAAQVGVTVPLHSAEHFYVVTEAVAGVGPDLPVLRDPDGYTYFKQEVDGLVVGGFEPEAKPWVAPDAIPRPFEFQLLPEDWEHFSVLMDEAVRRIPALAETGIRKFYNGPESFTPDNQFVMGEAPGLAGYFVGAGFNSVGIASAGGAGRALAEWIDAGEPQDDLVAVDIRRFAPFHGRPDWLRERVVETLGLHYAIPWPDREPRTGRDVRLSPLHVRLRERGAVFGTKMGWERPLYFAGEQAAEPLPTWGHPGWQETSAAEQVACRGDVAVFDQTSFSKYEVSGPGALATLQWICAADVDVEVGRCVYTPFLNARGTYEADVTVTRTGTDEFWVVSGSASTVRDLDWIRRHGRGGSIEVVDRTDDFAVLGVMGPAAPELLGTLFDTDLGDPVPFATSTLIGWDGRQVRASRMTYVGEDGFELTVPVTDAPALYDAVMTHSADGSPPVRAVDAGYAAIESLRLEKGYRAFGRDLTPDVDPVEAGLVFATALRGEKGFLGRDGLEARRRAAAEANLWRRIVSLQCSSPEPMLWGGEVLLVGETVLGRVTSAAWGATVGACVGLGLLQHHERVREEWLAGLEAVVDVAGERWPVRLSLRAPL